MAIIFQNTNLTSATAFTPTLALAAGDTLVVAADIEVSHTGNDRAVESAGSATVQVLGTVFGIQGVRLFGTAGARSSVFVGDNGVVTGTADGIVLENTGFLDVVNRGEISGIDEQGVQFFGGSGGSVTNYGSIFGKINGVLTNFSAVTVTNYGTIGASTQVGGLALGFGGGADTVINVGSLQGSVSLSSGDDFFDGRGGRVTAGEVRGDAGNDTIYGGLGADKLLGGSENDTLYFDAEDLRFGSVFGGSGYDTGYNTDEVTALTINMQAQQLEGYFGSAADETVIAGNLGGFGLFASMGAGSDLVDGTTVGDNINGGAGIDVLYGRGGLDDLAGGLGGDWVQGGAGADTFRYNALTDSTVNGQDFIADFSTADGDKINLTNALAGLAPATFNTGFGTGTSVYVFAGGGGTSLVQVYTAATLQMQIVVSQATLAASDFVF